MLGHEPFPTTLEEARVLDAQDADETTKNLGIKRRQSVVLGMPQTKKKSIVLNVPPPSHGLSGRRPLLDACTKRSTACVRLSIPKRETVWNLPPGTIGVYFLLN